MSLMKPLEGLVTRLIGAIPSQTPKTDAVPEEKPGFATAFAMKASDLLYGMYSLGASGPRAYMETNGINDEKTFTIEKGGMVGALEILGQYKMIEPDTFIQMIDDLEQRWRTILSGRGVTFDFVVQGGDKDLIEKQLEDAIAPNIATSKRFGLGVERILKQKVPKLVEYCAYEKVYMCIWVDQTILEGAEYKNASQEVIKRRAMYPLRGGHAVDIHGVAHNVESTHRSIVNQVGLDLKRTGIVNVPIDCANLLRELRLMTEPNNTEYNWQPSLPGMPVARKETVSGKSDYSHLLPPSLDKQLFPNPVGDIVETNKLINFGGKMHGGVIVTRPCLTPTNFDELYTTLSDAGIPYRVRLLVSSDGLNGRGMRARSTLAYAFAVFDFTGTTNGAINKSVKYLKELREESETIVGLTIMADTWVPLTKDDEAYVSTQKDVLNIQVEKLTKAIQSWGSMETKHVSGDPLFTSMATMPALTRKAPGETAAAPLRDALVLLPLNRPAQYWKTGGMLLRTRGGKLIPYSPVSSKQKAWGEIIIAPQRYGKSFWQQARNMALWTASGISHLPYIMTLDIGYSSSGFVNLVKYSLPEEKRHLAVHVQMEMSVEFAINPFDTQLGARYPTASKLGFLQNLIGLLVADDNLHVQDGMLSLISKLTKQVYETYSDARNPKPYQQGQNAEIDEWMESTNFVYPGQGKLTWWKLTDYLFGEELYHLASVAQRYAVPLLSDIAVAAADPEIAITYASIRVGTQETATEFFTRTLADIVDAYPVLSAPTQFDIGDARIVALDLEKVTGDDISPAGIRQACVMYLLGREVLIGRLKVDKGDVDKFPKHVRPYHMQRVKALRETTKSLNYDEAHRFRGQSQVVAALDRDIREGPKYRLVTSLATQEIKDLDPSMVNLAANKILLGVGSPAEAKRVQELCGLTDTARDRLNSIRRAGKHGSTALYILDIEEDEGPVIQELMLTLGPEEVWAYSTTNEDNALRQALYDRVGVTRTLELLMEYFPETTITDYLEQLRESLRSSIEVDFISEMTEAMTNGNFDRQEYLNSVAHATSMRAAN